MERDKRPKIDLEALRAAQQAERERAAQEAAQTSAAETEPDANEVAALTERQKAENYAAEHDMLLSELRRLMDRRDGLILERNSESGAVRQLAEAISRREFDLLRLSVDLDELKDQVWQVEEIAKGEERVAPEVEQAARELSQALEKAQREYQALEKQLEEDRQAYAELALHTEDIEVSERQIQQISGRVSELRNTPAVREVIIRQENAESEVRNHFKAQAVEVIKKYRFSDRERGAEGKKFAGELADDLLDEEIFRLGIDRIADPGERLAEIERIAKAITLGIETAATVSPYFAARENQGWQDKEAVLNDEEREAMLKGCVLAQLMDSAYRPADEIGGTLGYRARDHKGKLEPEDPKRQQRMLEDLLPIINKIKAAAYIDSIKPPAANLRSEATNVFFASENYFRRTFQSTAETEDNFPRTLNKLGFVNYPKNPALPVYPKAWDNSSEGKKKLRLVKAQYKEQTSQRQEEVNEVRAGRQMRLETRLTELPEEIEQAKQQLDWINGADFAESAGKYYVALNDLPGCELEYQQIENRLATAQEKLKEAEAGFKAAGPLAKRRILGKGAAANSVDEAKAEMRQLEAQRQDAYQKIDNLHQVMEDNQCRRAHELLQSGEAERLRRRLPHQIEKLQAELNSYQEITWNQPVEVV